MQKKWFEVGLIIHIWTVITNSISLLLLITNYEHTVQKLTYPIEDITKC